MDNETATNQKSQMESVIFILRLACFFVFIGRAWQHLFLGDAPFTVLLWDEELLTPYVNLLLHMSWDEYARSSVVETTIRYAIYFTGAFYAACAAISLMVNNSQKFLKTILWIGFASLVFLAFLYFKDRFYNVGQFFEYSAQFMSPALLIWALSKPQTKYFEFALRLSVALTFICHGLYAFGFYPVPGNFQDMTIQILNVSDDQARSFLELAGILDFAVGALLIIGIFKPFGYAYAVFWGTATSFARLFANVSWDLFAADMKQWFPEFLMRLPHGLLPLAGLILTSAFIASRVILLLNSRLRRC